MGLAAGMLVKLRAHDLIRGGLRDAENLAEPLRGAGIAVARVLASHSKVTEFAETTREYVGDVQDMVHNKRAESSFRDKLAPESVQSPFPSE